MPNKEEHSLAAKHNSEFRHETVFSVDKYNDWKAVVIFYEALHQVEEYFSRFGKNYTEHFARREAMALDSKLKNVKIEFDELYAIANKGRYKCIKISKRDIDAALDNLRIISISIKQYTSQIENEATQKTTAQFRADPKN